MTGTSSQLEGPGARAAELVTSLVREPGYEALRIFVSSTFTEFKVERKELFAALNKEGYDAWAPEDEGAYSGSNHERCKGRLDWADVLVALVGKCYGTRHPASQDRESIVEWEFDTATQRRRESGSPQVFLYLTSEIENDPKLAETADQTTFVQRLKHFEAGWGYDRFDSPGALADKVVEKIRDWSRRVAAAFARMTSPAGMAGVVGVHGESESIELRAAEGLALTRRIAEYTGAGLMAVSAIAAILVLIDPFLANPLLGVAEWDWRWRFVVPVSLATMGLAGLLLILLTNHSRGSG